MTVAVHDGRAVRPTLGRVARIGDGCMARRLLGCAFTSKNRKPRNGRERSAATSATG